MGTSQHLQGVFHSLDGCDGIDVMVVVKMDGMNQLRE
jgi:hypothetical protein